MSTDRALRSPAARTAHSATAAGSTQPDSTRPISSGRACRVFGETATWAASPPSACRPTARSIVAGMQWFQRPERARLANAAGVAVRVDGDPLADAPAADVAPHACDPACRLVAHDE